MCGRYQFSQEQAELRGMLRQLKERYPDVPVKTGEVFPTDTVPVLIGEGAALAPQPMGWGFPNFRNKGVIINARSETAGEKKMFQHSLVCKRCIVPTSGFFEWSHTEGKRKYLFREPSTELLYLAGLYNDFAGERRFVILIQDANNSMCEIHNRMPVILQRGELHAWATDNSQTFPLLRRIGPELTYTEVAPDGA